MRIGKDVKLIDLIAGETIKAKISGMSPITDQKSSSVSYYVDFINPGAWFPGDTVKVIIPISVESAFLVPQNSVVFRNGYAQIFKLVGNKVKGIPVKHTITSKGLVWIKGDLKTGMKIVVGGANKVLDGATVIIQTKVENK